MSNASRLPRGLIQKSKARMAAIQLLYGVALSENTDPLEKQILQFMTHYDEKSMAKSMDSASSIRPDLSFFKELCTGVTEQRDALDYLITKHLHEPWSLTKMSDLMHALLCVAIFEMKTHPNLALNKMLSDYVTIAHGFFSKEEVHFINAILDAIGHDLRG